ncbi:MAG: hypothetical protein Q7J44_16565 [Pseudotabrizicola sp.]|uniref:hypothetical protein n=1 Tax=Pseudotabrizicola sp. TaxID=2939647 RepID=UPI0027189B35|nr:hypothetical protein [Pseudotabrizicola sp.]MDO9640152.1 hypothetical protein [Pseudotabrizicola sp.]
MRSSFLAETLWSSSLQQADLPRVRDFLENNGFQSIDVALTPPQKVHATRVRWSTYYDATGHCISQNYSTPIPVGSMFLKLTFNYDSVDARDAGRIQNVLVANALRMMFGVPIARELVLVRHAELDCHGKSIIFDISDVGFASAFDVQNLNTYDSPPIEEAKLRPMPLEASTLLDSAFAQRYPYERFILMWLAFEAVIHTHSGGGSNGKKRHRYFYKELGSQVASEEVKRIFKIRNDTFKEGRLNDVNFDQMCWSLYAALQLAMMEDCPQRTAYLAGYEDYIKTQANVVANHF